MGREKRNSNIEILRILAMFLIVLSHYVVHGSTISNPNFSNPINAFFLDCFNLGNLGVAIFTMITGYFLINSNSIKIKKIIMIIIQTLTVSSICFLSFTLSGYEQITIQNVLKSFLPILFKQYWFVTAYVLLYLFSPFINKFLKSLKKSQHFALNILLIVIFSILSYITLKNELGSPLFDMLVFYSIGSYFSLYSSKIFDEKKTCIIILLSCLILMPLSILFFNFLSNYYVKFKTINTYFYHRMSPLVLLVSSCLLCLFKNMKERKNVIINKFASLTFGIYLIHENMFVRQFLWKDIFDCSLYMNSPMLYLHLFLSVNIVFFGAALIELIRYYCFDYLFKKYAFSKIDSLQNKITSWYNSKFDENV